MDLNRSDEESAQEGIIVKGEHLQVAVPPSPSSSSSSPPYLYDANIKSDPDEESNGGTRPEETKYLEQLINHESLQVLESGVSIGIGLLDKLKLQLGVSKTPDTNSWLDLIAKLKERTKPQRTVIGVVGNTGSGKSSVINALMDEERLLPTNCLRACTASPTEISYNYSEDPTQRYRAEVVFITLDEWRQELECLFNDVLDSYGEISRDTKDPESEAGVAYAKLKSVYPPKTKEMIAKGTPNEFANDASLRAVLGSVKLLSASSAQDLYGRLQVYVDSKEKITGGIRRKKNDPIEYWPLIKVVRLYTKADALSTGAVVVDLPGVQDSNAARAAVAESYMKLCTSLWIVAPITRAVDDKTAKSLLGDSFRRQLKYDGTYSVVSFICSKTDDISITEAADSLGLEEEFSESWETVKTLKGSREGFELALAGLRGRKETLEEMIEEIEGKIEIWHEMKTQVEQGKIVYAPQENSKKRKRRTEPFSSLKNGNVDHFDTDDDDSDSMSDDESPQPDTYQEPLTKEAIEEAYESFKDQRKEMRRERRELKVQIEATSTKIKDAGRKQSEIEAEVKTRCIRGRNDYSREAIKMDFAMGVKELDQENAEHENEATFDPEEDTRDYDEVARTLPVFCVSSRAYQKLSGRLQKDDFHSHGFISTDDTEIPQLRQHTKKLTDAGRVHHYRAFLNDLIRLTNSLKLWTTNDGARGTLTDVEKRREEMHLRKLLNDLEEEFKLSIRETVKKLQRSLQKYVYRKLEVSIPMGVNAATDTVAGWGANKSSGGLAWSTYKAVVRRNGIHKGTTGLHNFNEDLFEPISRNLATGWEKTFQRRLPTHLDEFSKMTKAQLERFHAAVQAGVRARRKDTLGLATLSSHVLVHARMLEQLSMSLRTTVTDLQRDVNRQFTPVISAAMKRAYVICAEESGQGSFKRMKAAMANHVEDTRKTMFHDAANYTQTRLESMCETLQKQMDEELLTSIFGTIFHEYMQVLVGATVDRHDERTPEDLAIRAGIDNLLQRSDSLFAPALGELGAAK